MLAMRKNEMNKREKETLYSNYLVYCWVLISDNNKEVEKKKEKLRF